MPRFLPMLASVNLGWLRRKSSGASWDVSSMVPVRNPAAQRCVGDEPDPELADGVQHAVHLHVAGPQRVLAL
jgi:hypothetical protein